MSTLEIILLIISIVELILIVVVFLRNHFKMKKIKNLQESLYNELNIPTEPLTKRVESSKAVLEMINDMINTEIVVKKRFEIFLGEKSKNLDIDKVIQDVSTDVFNYLSDNLFVKEELVFTNEYVMSYIIHRTTIAYINYLNNNVADQF